MIFTYVIYCWLGITSTFSDGWKTSITHRQQKYFIEAPVDFFELDGLGRIWVVDKNNQIHVFDQDGNKKYSFTDSRLGKISSIDTSNPLKVMVFYADFGILRFLDITLAEIEQIRLKDSGKFLDVTAAALSNDNHIWIYDEQWQQIFKINSSFEILKESQVFNKLGLADFKPGSLTEKSDLLLAGMPGNGFVLFDNHGQMKKRMVSREMVNHQFEGNKIMVQNTKGLAIQALDPPHQFKLLQPKGLTAEPYKQIRLSKDRWYVAYENGINWVPK